MHPEAPFPLERLGTYITVYSVRASLKKPAFRVARNLDAVRTGPSNRDKCRETRGIVLGLYFLLQMCAIL